MPAELLSELLTLVSQARLLWQLGATLPAIIGVTTLMDTLKEQDSRSPPLPLSQ